MRLAVFSDIHGNLEALETVLDHAAQQRVHRYMCLGDIVGYGPDPEACIRRLRSLSRLNGVLGNHDAAAAGKTSPHAMTRNATRAILWTRGQLSEESVAYVKTLRTTLTMGDMIFCHANPYNPLAWRYVENRKYAARSFRSTKKKFLFLGHSHRPLVITRKGLLRMAFQVPEENLVLDVSLRNRQIFNCGSVGQPRDKNPRAAYLIYDTRKARIEFYRLRYDYRKTAEKIRQHGLPDFLALRLAKGV